MLTIAVAKEFRTVDEFTGAARGQSDTPVPSIAHDYLAREDADRVVQPQLAIELPSIERGTWRVNPDHTMETTWRIRPNVKWHDGAPFTSADLLFAFQLFTDPEFNPTSNPALVRLMDSATASDPQTLVVRWSATTPEADRGSGLDPMPRHLLEEIYRTNKQALTNHALLGSEFIGLGP